MEFDYAHKAIVDDKTISSFLDNGNIFEDIENEIII